MDYTTETEEIYGTCYICGDYCNKHSQACGRCMRGMNFYQGPPSPLFKPFSNPSNEVIDLGSSEPLILKDEEKTNK